MSVAAIRLLICFYATLYGVNPALATDVARRESDFVVEAVGDHGKAVGLFQWHRPSWRIVRRHMGKSTDDLRADPSASTEAAMFAMGPMKLGRWWSTWDMAQRNATPPRESITAAKLRRIKARYEEAR